MSNKRKLLGRDDLHEYQNRAVEFIKKQGRVMLMLDMGLGKTTSTLTAVSDLLDGVAINKVLVIAPLRVANSVWTQEARKWSHLKHLEVQVCTGNLKQRVAALHHDADVYVINRENVVWLSNYYGNKWPFDAVVIDESSSFKNSQTKRFRALRRVLEKVNYTVLLTGTPAPNGLMDLWSQIYLCDEGEALGRTLTEFRGRYFTKSFAGYGWEINKGSDKKIHSAISHLSLSMQQADYLELPPRVDINEPVELSPAELKKYQEFEKELFLELEDGEGIEVMNAAHLANKLLQYAAGAIYTDEFGNWSKIHDRKIEALKELRDSEGENMLVAYNFKSDLERIQKAFPDARVLDSNPDTITAWNSGEISMLLAHPSSAGHGLNLQEGGSLALWFSPPWSLELYQQFNARLHRQGQTKPVRIIHLISKGTIDERVMVVLGNKAATQGALLSALK